MKHVTVTPEQSERAQGGKQSWRDGGEEPRPQGSSRSCGDMADAGQGRPAYDKALGLWPVKSPLVPAAARGWTVHSSPWARGARETSYPLPKWSVFLMFSVTGFSPFTFSVAKRDFERSVCAKHAIGTRLQSCAGGFRTHPASPIRALSNAVGFALSVIHPNKAGQPHIPEVLGLLILYSVRKSGSTDNANSGFPTTLAPPACSLP